MIFGKIPACELESKWAGTEDQGTVVDSAARLASSLSSLESSYLLLADRHFFLIVPLISSKPAPEGSGRSARMNRGAHRGVRGKAGQLRQDDTDKPVFFRL